MTSEAPPLQHSHAARPRAACLVVCLLLFCVFGLTASQFQFGYEGARIEQAEALLDGRLMPRVGGGILPYTQAGPLEVAVYLPFAATRQAIERHGLLAGGRQLAYVFVIPLLTTLMCAVFFAIAWGLYRRVATATALTLLLGLTTKIWPYTKFGMETQQTLWTLVGLWGLILYDRHPTRARALLFGLALAALPLTKITGLAQAGALGLAALVTQGWMRRRRDRPSLEHLALAVLTGLIGLTLALGLNRLRYGGWLWGGRYDLSAETDPYPFFEGLWAVLFSPGKSFFIYSPTLVIGLWYWGRFVRRFPLMKAVLPLMLLLALFHIHMRPWADETWGVRRLHFLIPVLMLPLGLWWEQRADLGRWTRGIAWLVIAAGAAVQLLAVSFDYTNQFYVLGNRAVYSQENTVWDPQFSPLRFDVILWKSAWQAAHGDPIQPFVYQRHYLPWWTPTIPPEQVVIPIDGKYAQPDLWYMQQSRQWPGHPYWFASPSSYLAVLLALGALISALLLRRGLRPAQGG